MGKVRVGLCVAGVVLVLAGCSTRVGGRPVGSDAPAEALNIDMFDDLSTVDPCSLTGPAAFEEYGIATMPGKPTFDECAVKVATDEGRVTVRLGEWQTEDALPEGRSVVATLDDGTSIVHVGRDCDMALVLGDGGVVLTSVETSGTVVPSDDVLCGLTQGAARGVHDVAAGGRVEHWDDLPRNSFGRVAACEVLDDEEVAAAIGDTSAAFVRLPGRAPVPVGQRRWRDADREARLPGGRDPTGRGRAGLGRARADRRPPVVGGGHDDREPHGVHRAHRAHRLPAGARDEGVRGAAGRDPDRRRRRVHGGKDPGGQGVARPTRLVRLPGFLCVGRVPAQVRVPRWLVAGCRHVPLR